MQKQKIYIQNGIFYLIYFWLCWVFVAAQALFQLQQTRATLQLWYVDFWLQRFLSLWGMGSRALGLQQLQWVSSVVEVPSSRARAQQLWPRTQLPPTCGIFSDQILNPCLLHWQVDSLPVSHQGSPTKWDILDYVFHCSTNNTHCVNQVLFCK